MSDKIVFFGNERLATGVSTDAPTLRGLLSAGYEVAAVIVAQAEAGKSRRPRGLEVADIAKEHGIPLFSPPDLADSVTELAGLGARAGVLVAYGKIVPPAIIDIFPAGIVNIHPSLLPLHRGPTPLESVILEGAAETGVSLMRLGAKLDSGPVYAQEKLALTGTETKQELADKLALVGSRLVTTHIPAVLDGSLLAAPQDESAATYDKPIVKSDGTLDFTKPAGRLEREIRAYQGWPRSRTTLGSTPVIITKAHVAEGSGTPGSLRIQDKELGVYTAEKALIIDSLIPAGKPEMPAAAFMTGYSPS